jgi:hypothetical protein
MGIGHHQEIASVIIQVVQSHALIAGHFLQTCRPCVFVSHASCSPGQSFRRLRLGLSHNLDFHWASSDFLHIMNGDGDRTGFGDSRLGLRHLS